MALIGRGDPGQRVGLLQLLRMGGAARDDNVRLNQLGKAFRADDAPAVQLAAVGQHQDPPFQAVKVGVQAAAGVAGLADHLRHAVDLAVLLPVRHGGVFVLDGVDAAEVHIHPQRLADALLEQLLPGLAGQPLTQVAEGDIHLVLVAVLLPEAERRREIGDAAHQIRAVLPHKGAHHVVAAQAGAVAAHVARGDVLLGVLVHHLKIGHQLFDRGVPGHLALVAELSGHHGGEGLGAGSDLEQGFTVHRLVLLGIGHAKALLEHNLSVLDRNQDAARKAVLFPDLFDCFL